MSKLNKIIFFTFANNRFRYKYANMKSHVIFFIKCSFFFDKEKLESAQPTTCWSWIFFLCWFKLTGIIYITWSSFFSVNGSNWCLRAEFTDGFIFLLFAPNFIDMQVSGVVIFIIFPRLLYNRNCFKDMNLTENLK